jgi:hypothetical protein
LYHVLSLLEPFNPLGVRHPRQARARYGPARLLRAGGCRGRRAGGGGRGGRFLMSEACPGERGYVGRLRVAGAKAAMLAKPGGGGRGGVGWGRAGCDVAWAREYGSLARLSPQCALLRRTQLAALVPCHALRVGHRLYTAYTHICIYVYSLYTAFYSPRALPRPSPPIDCRRGSGPGAGSGAGRIVLGAARAARPGRGGRGAKEVPKEEPVSVEDTH